MFVCLGKSALRERVVGMTEMRRSVGSTVVVFSEDTKDTRCLLTRLLWRVWLTFPGLISGLYIGLNALRHK